MPSNTTDFSKCKVRGFVVKSIGDTLRPFLERGSLLASTFDSIKTDEEQQSWYPVTMVMELIDVAEKHGLLSRLAENRATITLSAISKNTNVRSPLEALFFLAKGIPNHHKGDIGQFTVTKKGDQGATVINGTYLKCTYLIPMLKKTLAGFGAVNLTVVHKEDKCRIHGAPVCEFAISWEEDELLKLRQSETSST